MSDVSTDTCPFCAIARGEAPATITHASPDVIAFKDLSPQAPFHELVIPRRHIASLADTVARDGAILGELMLIGRHRALVEGYGDRGFRVVMNSGPEGHQTVGHIHLHVLAGRTLGWPPG